MEHENVTDRLENGTGQVGDDEISPPAASRTAPSTGSTFSEFDPSGTGWGGIMMHNWIASCLTGHNTVWSDAGHNTQESQDWVEADHKFAHSQAGHNWGDSDDWDESGHEYVLSRQGHNIEVSLNHTVELSQEWENADHFNIWSWGGHNDTLSQEQITNHNVDLSMFWLHHNHNYVRSWEGHSVWTSHNPPTTQPRTPTALRQVPSEDPTAEWSEVVKALTPER